MSDSTEAQPQGGELLHWRFRAGVEETMCGLSVWVAATLLPEAATCPLCQAAFVGYKFGRADLPCATAGTAKWDKSDLKEACERGLKMGRTRQEFDLQLLLDMLLEIERLEATPRATGETTVEAAAFGCEHCTCTCDNCAPCGETNA
jgi:hypothetical protein